MSYQPTWDTPAGVHAFVSQRQGGVSPAPFSSLNLGKHVGDQESYVAENRKRLFAQAKGTKRLHFVHQVHGNKVLRVRQESPENLDHLEADALITDQVGLGLVILIADCLPVFFATEDGEVVGVAHAGWKGLAAGILENTAKEMRNLWREKPNQVIQRISTEPKISAGFGPAIGPSAFEVGDDVRSAFVKADSMAELFFKSRSDQGKPGKYLANIYALASLRLGHADVAVTGPCKECTVLQTEQYFSYRRDGTTGRQGAVIWRSF